MARTRLTTDPNEVDRWATERDLVPVSDETGVSLVPAGSVGVDRDRLHWDEFHAERDEETVVVDWGETVDEDGLSVTHWDAALDRLDVGEAERREAVRRLHDGETVAVRSGDDSDAGDRGGPDPEPMAGDATGERRTEPAERDVGKVVVAASGDEVGMVTAVESNRVHVDPHPGLTERALGTLGWSGIEDEDVAIEPAEIEAITSTVVRLAVGVDDARFEETTAGK